MLRGARFLALPSLAAMLLASGVAVGQTTTSSSATVSQSGQLYPHRIGVNGADYGSSTRSQNLNPLGISYSDCIQDMVLRFNVAVNGFDGSQSLQVWATKSGDCTSPGSRGIGATQPTCWLVNQGFTGQIINTPTTRSFDVRVQDLVGAQNLPPVPATNYVRQGASACSAQSTFVAVPIDVFFLPLDASQNVAGTAYKYHLVTDLVGPPAPATVSIADGDTLFVVNWTQNSDSDTSGYDVFIDPVPGQEGAATTILSCPDTGTVTPAASDGSILDAAAASDADDANDANDANDAAVTDAAIATTNATVTDAACFLVNIGGTTAGTSACNDPVLTSGIVQAGGATSTAVYDEAGTLIDGSVVSGVGGISTILSQYQLSGVGGVTISDKATGTYTISGLKNGTTYNVVVAAVDGSGNVGPPSQEACDYPAPVNDFWNLYRADGGRAGGGFCALEAVGEPARSTVGLALAGATCALALRRRRKSK